MSLAAANLPHDEFVAGYRAGRVRVRIDRARAARFVSARLLLPFVLLPFFGGAVALALLGHWIPGTLVFLLALGLRHAVRASGQGFVLARALRDAELYRTACAAGLLSVELTEQPPA